MEEEIHKTGQHETIQCPTSGQKTKGQKTSEESYGKFRDQTWLEPILFLPTCPVPELVT